jgi:sterol desaturase/sphingolipid hydroxylase (fatty acid hydroxylase superfamily)
MGHGGDMNLLQGPWDALLEVFGADLVGHPLFFIVWVMTTVVGAGLVFSLIDVFVSHKMTAAAAGKYLAITLPGYLLVFVLLNWLPIEHRFPVPEAAPSLAEFTLGFVICMVVGDVLSYWWHRLEHGSRLVFRKVHYVHHSVESPLTVWSGFFVHPVESAVVFTMFYVYPFVFQVHPLIFGVYAAVNTFITMVTHCGYDIPGYPKFLFASAPMHEFHHADKKPVNFCVLLTLGDRLWGTFKRDDEPTPRASS